MLLEGGEGEPLTDPRAVAGAARAEGMPRGPVEVGDVVGERVSVRVLEGARGEDERPGGRHRVDERRGREPAVGAGRVRAHRAPGRAVPPGNMIGGGDARDV